MSRALDTACMQARDIMTARVATVGPDTPIDEIARRLIERGVSALPVVDEHGVLLGIVSEGDLLLRPELGTDKRPSWWLALLLEPEDRAAQYVKTHGRVAKDIMSTPVISVDESTDIGDIAELLEKHQIKRVPVVRGGKVVGIVSRANVLHGVATGRVPEPARTSDQKLRADIAERLHRDAGVRDEYINVTVVDGIAHLWGSVPTRVELDAARVLVENTPGIRKLKNHLRVAAQPKTII
jgi:CBS domain-containing protein